MKHLPSNPSQGIIMKTNYLAIAVLSLLGSGAAMADQTEQGNARAFQAGDIAYGEADSYSLARDHTQARYAHAAWAARKASPMVATSN
jgi:hypothetical protein